MNRKILLRLFALVTCLLCSLGAAAAEAYACYTSADSTLTFYYDSQRSARTGTTYNLNMGDEDPDWVSASIPQSVKTVTFESTFANYRPKTTVGWFFGCNRLRTITGIEYLNTVDVTDMNGMFMNCSNLRSLDLSHFNTAKVTKMDGMFYGCSRLTTIYVSSEWSTNAVTSSIFMFTNCTSLVGGMGTTYNSNHVDKAYAHIDGGTAYPGYFTDPNNVMPSQAYACYTPSNTTLTFYYDNQRSSRTGTTYDLNTEGTNPVWVRDGTNSSITKVVFNSSFAGARPTIATAWFYSMENLTSITGLNYLNTSEVTVMAWMFYGCTSLTSLDLSNFNTAKVTKMNNMFDGCSGLTYLNVSSFNTANVTQMYYMFDGCSGLTSLDVSNFNTAKVTDMQLMFYGCSGLTSLNVSNFNTSRVTNMSRMFGNCTGLTNLNVSNFNTSQVTDMNHMFNNCRNLTTLDLSSFNTANVNDMSYMFNGCTGLTSLNVSSFNTSSVTNMDYMFNNCYAITTLDLSNFNTSNVTTMKYMFAVSSSAANTNNLTTIYVGENWNTAAVTDSEKMFWKCTNLVGGMGTTYTASHLDKAYAHIDGGTANPGYLSSNLPAEPYACYTPSNTTLTFYYDNVRSARTGTTYDLNTGTANPGWFTDNSYKSITKVVFNDSFSNARPTSTCVWFGRMTNLTSISGISNLNTSSVEIMNYMFYGCSGLSSLDLSGFNTDNVTSMEYMFFNCSNLVALDLGSFNTAGVTDMNYMFRGCSKLTTIYVSENWSTDAVTSSAYMFTGCTSLVGGMGTTYNANHLDKTYAHIDGGPSNPGYLTSNLPAAPYACYTPSNTTLTFYCDNVRAYRTGTTYDLNMGTNKPVWNTDSTCRSVTRIVFDASFADARPTTTAYWFHLMESLTTIEGIEYLNTSAVTNMSSMFYKCNQLTNLDVSHFNTANVTSFASLFYNCSNLTSIDVSGFNTAKATTMYGMFYNCCKLANLNVTNFNTANVTIMYGMFFNCSKLTSLNVTNFNTAKVTNMVAMFYNCRGLTSLDLSSFNTAKVTNMNQMIGVCDHLTTIYVGGGWSTAAVTSSNNMFLSSTKLVGGMGTTYDASHIDAAYAHIDGGTANPGYFTDINAPAEPEAYACYTPSNTTLTFYYDNQRSTRTGTTYDLNEGDNVPGWNSDFVDLPDEYLPVTQVTFDPSFAVARPTSTCAWFYRMKDLTSINGIQYLHTDEVTNMLAMFSGCSSLASLDVSGFNTANVTDMAGMFSGCSSLTSLDVSGFNTANVTDMGCMFQHCTGVTSLNLTNFNTANVTRMEYMFYVCSSLTSLDLSGFNTAKVTDMRDMFNSCTGLTSLDLSGFNTSQVTDMSDMFLYCGGLTSLDVSSFNTANVTRMGYMFSDCTGLTSLDLSSFNTAKVTTMYGMFDECSNLTTIYAGDAWSTVAVTMSNNMFKNCTSLVGGQGTTYDANHTDKAYAHIDGGTSNPGYFTDINAPAGPEAYACFTPSNATLTFYYDTQRSTRTGTTYDLNDGMNAPDWSIAANYELVTHVVFDPSFADARPNSTCSWFWGMTNLQSITGMDYMNTEDVTTMWCMFYNCSSLRTIDISSFDTHKVTNVLSLFYGCTNLTTIYAGDGWNRDAMNVYANMFTDCFNLVGGQGTTYDPNHTDYFYARIDGGPDFPGYFTEKVDFVCGDVNGDNNVTIADVTALIDYLLSGDASSVNLGAADCNQDNGVSIADVTALIDYLLSGSW